MVRIMNRRAFLYQAGFGLAGLSRAFRTERDADVVIIGGGTGGCAAALAALELGCRVTMVEETDWIGGQLTSQAVPPDEHRWIEQFGSSRLYRRYRQLVRQHYRRHYPLTPLAREAEFLNVGSCGVSRICHEPAVSLSVLRALLMPHISAGYLHLLPNAVPVAADVEGDRIRSVRVRRPEGEMNLTGRYFLDATEDGALLPLAGAEYVTGAEPDSDELHASSRPGPDNMQAATWCFAMDYVEGEDYRADAPASYDFWRQYEPELTPPWPGRLLSLAYSNPVTLEPQPASFDPRPGARTRHFNLWSYRRLIDPANFEEGTYDGGISLVNWPQNDYMLGNLFGGPDARRHMQWARELSLSLFHWLQTEVPREDGGAGWPGLRLRGDLLGTGDGLAKRPYLRESRRIRAAFTVREEHVGKEALMVRTGLAQDALKSVHFEDSVGVGSYRLDLHPSTRGDNYIDIDTLPFEIPLGALLPVRMENLLPACKNLGVTHLTNGCYRLHPVEWCIGEAAGSLAAFCLHRRLVPREVHRHERHLQDFQRQLEARGVDISWPASFY